MQNASPLISPTDTVTPPLTSYYNTLHSYTDSYSEASSDSLQLLSAALPHPPAPAPLGFRSGANISQHSIHSPYIKFSPTLQSQVFHSRVSGDCRFPADILTTIFSNLKSIYKFHAEFLLPQVRLTHSVCTGSANSKFYILHCTLNYTIYS